MTEETNNHSDISLGDQATMEKVIVIGWKTLLVRWTKKRDKKNTWSDSRILLKPTVWNDMSGRLRVQNPHPFPVYDLMTWLSFCPKPMKDYDPSHLETGEWSDQSSSATGRWDRSLPSDLDFTPSITDASSDAFSALNSLTFFPLRLGFTILMTTY